MIEVRELTRFYGPNAAVEEVSFSIENREIVGFLGLNGAGKTTTLKMLAGLLLPSAGSVTINGVDAIENSDAIRAKIGFLPEDPPLYTDMRVGDFLRWCGSIRGASSSEVEERLPSVLTKCQLTEVADRVIEELSHGYRKRVGIAQAILHKPDLVILDEPISGLDPVQIVEMRKVIQHLKQECTVLISSHILSEVHQTCDRILVLHEGRLVAEGTEQELSHRAHSGSGGLNLVVRGSASALGELLDAQAGVASHEIVAGPGDLVNAHVTLTGDDREALVAAIVGAGLGIRRVSDAETELENIFLDITKQTEAK
ncbi:MAG: ABC transporter ATP-binding protein [Myxococcota bacterium]|nr:ABC transporter ATP-binding protein [Myxococcota bacterium]